MTLGMMSCSQRHSRPKSDAARAPDLVVLNAAVVTEDAQRPSAQALAVSGDHFVYVGADAGARALVGKGTRVIDLKGRSVLPGLIDSHIHPSLGEWYWHQLCSGRGVHHEGVLREACDVRSRVNTRLGGRFRMVFHRQSGSG
jgi:Amidohydrolase family